MAYLFLSALIQAKNMDFDTLKLYQVEIQFFPIGLAYISTLQFSVKGKLYGPIHTSFLKK